MRTMTSRYRGTCSSCHESFPKGTVINFDRSAPKGTGASHTDCEAPSRSQPLERDDYEPRYQGSTYTEFSSGAVAFQNRNGRCEDAPCCGCCS